MTCVEGSWTQPGVSCATRAFSAVAFWVGIDGANRPSPGVNASNTLEQIGTESQCLDGQAESFAWHEILPTEPNAVEIAPMTVRPGDRMWAMVAYAGGEFELRIDNVTRQTTFSIVQAQAGALRRTAEWIVEAPSFGCPTACKQAPLADFGTVQLRGTMTIRGMLLPIDGGSATDRITMDRSTTLATASGLTGSGTTFSVTWRHR